MDNPRLPYLHEKTLSLPMEPGVYIMHDKSGKVIYVGKAKKLKNRVTSYFRNVEKHLPKVYKMVEHVHDFEYIVTDSEFEALILECSLIKQYAPKYNILLKDDKGYSCPDFSGTFQQIDRSFAEKRRRCGIPRTLYKFLRCPPDRCGSQQGFYAPDLQPEVSTGIRKGKTLPQLLYQKLHGSLPGKNFRRGI